MHTEFPQKTAEPLTLPDGTAVLVKCLTELLKTEAEEKAGRHARRECASLLKGGADYADAMADIRSYSPEHQARFLADSKLFPIREKALELFPTPAEPERQEPKPGTSEQTELAYGELCAAWEAACEEMERKRAEYIETRHKEEVEAALALKTAARIRACYEAFYAQEIATAYVKRLELETLLRAVRHADEPLRRYFGSVEAIQDFEDAAREELIRVYDTLTLSPHAIPTSPNASAA